ncbi:MAG: alcohol dehydrogenase catalytic domain-containing protein [Victivallaceae bacterium]
MTFGNFSVPECGDDELLVRVRATCICGTDLKIAKNGHRKLTAGQTIVLGHEFSGDIEEVGKQVKGYGVGQRVGLAPNSGCGSCDACIQGMSNYCSECTAFGINIDGSHAEYVRIPSNFIVHGNVIALPENISYVEAAALEAFSCVLNGIRSVKINLGDTVLIFGAGPIGLMHLMLALRSGAGNVFVADINRERIGKALVLGADAAFNSETGNIAEELKAANCGRLADVIITACPVAAVIEQSAGLLSAFGRLCVFGGLPAGCGPVEFDANAVHYKNLTITGTTGGSVRDYMSSMRLVSGGKINLNKIISDTFPLNRIEDAYKKAFAGTSGKVAMLADN